MYINSRSRRPESISTPRQKGYTLSPLSTERKIKMTRNVKIIYGGASFNTQYGSTATNVSEVLDYLEKEGITTIDSSEVYGDSEELLGAAKAASRGFVIDTKVGGGLSRVEASGENVVKAVEESLRKLDTDSVDVYYIHAPDKRIPLKDTLSGINAAHKSGKFKRFGLSNFSPAQVKEVYRTALENNFVLPSVYQGNYNAVGRRIETELFPILRKYGIAFYAYSPIAGGFLTKTPGDIANAKGRFDTSQIFGKMMHALYNKPSMLEFLAEFGKLARDEGISQAELAYRWIVYHSYLDGENGDGIIVGSRSGDQLTATLEGLRRGPLTTRVAERVDELWKGVEKDAILDNWNDFISENGL
ncbi:aldehyde reductase (GliO), putative [Talaromyces stipitatus ATCC 10500]|uniref:Aldehyde reductase (GliO), putative n=1 Tax=Talaromyces stipitatus (strain ATCC 10500 / CBS 375.48 / QM 6759 / NRRL 1006) TaxID=441959 RepID=B8M7X9_TALSN|nr:aldehyde reductase (GliO), putative [Talaromyces stipitatus ATCC 10500]EED19858.1 aldehyde reductase (GliO), putative [Talaromyces stipitatus ATCC 10500]